MRTFIDTSTVGDQRWEPLQVGADWHAFCQSIFQGVEGPEWEAMCYHYKDLHQAVKSKTPGENKKAKVQWAMKEAKDRGVDYCDTKHLKVILAFVMKGMSSDVEDGFSPPKKKVSTMWRTSCRARLRIVRAVRSCKDSYTKKSCVR